MEPIVPSPIQTLQHLPLLSQQTQQMDIHLQDGVVHVLGLDYVVW